MKLKQLILEIGAGALIFAAAALLTGVGKDIPTLILFAVLISGECLLAFKESGQILDLRILFTLSWLGGLMLSTLKLSNWANAWGTKMWFTVGGFYFLFLMGYEMVSLWMGEREERRAARTETAEIEMDSGIRKKKIIRVIYVMFAFGFVSFMIESIVFDFAYPAFALDTPHAYTAFHITGIHYFIAALQLIHPVSMILFLTEKLTKKERLCIYGINVFSILVPALLLSKFQIFMGLFLTGAVWIILKKPGKRQLLKMGIPALLFFIIISVYMIFRRSYPDDYLTGIFNFKNRETPMAVQYVYTYIVNNFENLNLLVDGPFELTFGRRQLFPFIAITGLKFLPKFREFITVLRPVTVEELTTLTIIYDVYGDFGSAGVYVFGMLFGALSAAVTVFTSHRESVFSPLLYAQLALYTSLAFFSTWFSNPTTWFFLGETVLIGLYMACWPKKKGEVHEEGN